MKIKKPTIAELLEQKGTLQGMYQELLIKTDNIRTEFAKAFSWTKKDRYSYNEDRVADYITPTWEQIFVELGKLLADKQWHDLEDRVVAQENEMFNLKEQIKKEIHPNL